MKWFLLPNIGFPLEWHWVLLLVWLSELLTVVKITIYMIPEFDVLEQNENAKS